MKKDMVNLRAETILDKMSIEEKIGQMMMVGISGQSLSENDIKLLTKYRVGGIILYDRNMRDFEQVYELVSNIQKSKSGRLPLYIAIDEEGGVVSRMKDRLKPPPSAEEIGKIGNPKVAETYAFAISKELKKMGVNINFAPVADIGLALGRSYGSEFTIVTKCVNFAVQGYMNANMLCCIKHFPGIGKCVVDSHIEKSSINISLDELLRDDLVPFTTIINTFPNDNFMVMVSHLVYEQLDNKYPASFSNSIVTDLLRKKLGYKGIIITDDLEMGAISKHYLFSDVGVKAIMAGADILLVCHNSLNFSHIYDGILQAYRRGTISQKRIDASVSLIIKNKLRHLLV